MDCRVWIIEGLVNGDLDNQDPTVHAKSLSAIDNYKSCVIVPYRSTITPFSYT